MPEVKERRIITRFFAEDANVQLVLYSDGELSLVVPEKDPVQIAKWGERRPEQRGWEMDPLLHECALPTKETP